MGVLAVSQETLHGWRLMQHIVTPGSSLTITCILKLFNASLAVRSGYVMTWELKCACWADGENHNDELSRDDSFMYGWAEGENHNIDELSGDDSCIYDTHDTYNQRIEWFWGCLKKESGWMYFGTWQVTQESLESLSVVVFFSFPKSNFYAFYVLKIF